MNCKGIIYNNINGKKYYAIEFKNVTSTGDIKVEHKEGKTNNDVQVVYYNGCNLTKVPQGLTKMFPNMKILDIHNSKLPTLSKEDLYEYTNLIEFDCYFNQIEFLPGNLFEGFDKLQLISFDNNNLKVLEPNILDGLDVKYVDFRENPNYDKCFSIYPNLHPNATLQEVKNQLFEKFNPQKIYKWIDGSLFGDIKDFIGNESCKDFNIEIGSRTFRVHKFLLMIRSPTLAEMLRNNPEADYLKLVDIPVEVFEVIFNFLYTDELPHDDGFNFLHLYAAASRLGVKKLANFAAMKILEQNNAEIAVEILDLSNKYGHDGLRQKAFKEIKEKYPKIEFKDDWAMDTEKVKKMIDFFKKMKAMEMEFSNSMK